MMSGAASIGVIRVDSEEELQKAYQRVVRDMSRAKVSTAAGGGGSLGFRVYPKP